MRRKFLAIALLCTFSLAGASKASAQDSGFGVGFTDVGPVVGLGGISGAGAGFGGRFETGLKALPDLGNGVLGLGVAVDWFNYSNNVQGLGNFSFSYIPVSATVNYHFHLDNKKIDPFVGVGLGDLFLHTSCSGNACGGESSGIYFVGHAGIRYFVQPKIALYADAGSGYGSLHVGVMFKVSDGK